ncbi:MAG TPA: ACT domain-containing protein, partial [Verrucomicrobiota bacterium]|nr:ACT domain-containing protein [Verrucomicrobiota bacterium]
KGDDDGEWQWPTRIHIDTDSAESRTIIEVESGDRLGLLHRISKVLTQHRLNIHVARISTEKGAAIDTFYVRTALGKKPTDKKLLQQIKFDLEAELSKHSAIGS